MIFIAAPLANAQVRQPVKWYFNIVSISPSEASLIFIATLNEGWHIYSQFIEEGGPLPTAFTFAPSESYSLMGKVREESMPIKSYDEIFMMDIVWFNKTAVFIQKVKLHAPVATIKGSVEFMVCTGEICPPPHKVNFSLDAKAEKPESKNSNPQPGKKEKKTHRSQSTINTNS